MSTTSTTLEVSTPAAYAQGVDLRAWRAATGVARPEASAASPGAAVIGVDYVPPMNARLRVEAPVRTSAQVERQLATMRLNLDQMPESFSWTRPDDIAAHHSWKPSKSPLLAPPNQYACGSCWAISSASVLSDRWAIWSKTHANPALSASYILACVPGSLKCSGGSPAAAGTFLENTGTVTAECWPYSWCSQAPECVNNTASEVALSDLVPQCATKSCTGKGTSTTYRAVERTTEALVTPEAVRTEILRNGPVVGVYRVFADFTFGGAHDGWKKTKGVYMHFPNRDVYAYTRASAQQRSLAQTYTGNHAVAVVGWGVERDVPNVARDLGLPNAPAGQTVDVPYWLVRNSWGTKWNGDGYFKIAVSDVSTGLNTQVALDRALEVSGVQFGGCTTFQPAVDGHATRVPTFERTARDAIRRASNGSTPAATSARPKNINYVWIGVAVLISVIVAVFIAEWVVERRGARTVRVR